jgi:hypothetical protein
MPGNGIKGKVFLLLATVECRAWFLIVAPERVAAAEPTEAHCSVAPVAPWLGLGYSVHMSPQAESPPPRSFPCRNTHGCERSTKKGSGRARGDRPRHNNHKRKRARRTRRKWQNENGTWRLILCVDVHPKGRPIGAWNQSLFRHQNHAPGSESRQTAQA